MHIAATLINVEDRLDRDLIGLIVPKAQVEVSADSVDAEFQQVQAAVLRECSVNLVRVKEAIASNVAGTLDVAALEAWPGLVAGIKAGLLMLGKTRAVEIVDGIAAHLKELLQPGGTAVPPNYLDRLADAVVSLEYYMETLQAGRADPWYMLDNALTCLQALTQMPKRVVPTVPPLGPEAYAATVLLADAGATARAHALQAGVAPPTLQGVAPTLHHSAQPRIGAKHPVDIDPELLALYIEEAREEVARIAKLFPAWEQNPLETDALSGIRRAFHTLKGSGRMVGATDISEFAWAIENLLNRIIENTLQRSPAILATVRDATVMAGELVNALEAVRPAPARAQDIVDRAHALASNKPNPAQTATIEALERTLDTRQSEVLEATSRIPTLVGRARVARGEPGGRLGSGRRGRRERRPVDAGRRTQRRPAIARDLQPRDAGQYRRRAAFHRRGASARCAPRCHGGGLSRLPHAGRQLAHGRSAPWHPSHRTARILGA